MPELSCTVQTCVHNYQYLCELDKIQVGGNSAKNAQETCCDSFEERREGSYSNKTDSMKSAQMLTARRKIADIMKSANVTQGKLV